MTTPEFEEKWAYVHSHGLITVTPAAGYTVTLEDRQTGKQWSGNGLQAAIDAHKAEPGVTDAQIAARLRSYVKDLERMDRSEDYRLRMVLRDILDGVPNKSVPTREEEHDNNDVLGEPPR